MNILWLAPISINFKEKFNSAPWVTSLAEELVNNFNIKITILNYSTEIKSNVEKLKYNNIDLIFLKVPKSRYDIISLYQIRISLIRKFLINICHQYDLIHIHGSEHQYECSVFKLPIKKIISIQGIMTEYVKKLKKSDTRYPFWKLSSYYEKKYLKFIDNFSCRTDWDKAFIKKINPSAKIFHNWEIIRPEFFCDNLNWNKEYILFTGGTNSIKGIEDVLIVFNKIFGKFKIKLAITGYTNKSVLQRIIITKKLNNLNSENVKLFGFQNVDELIKLFSKSILLLHPSKIDNSPNSICEAQIYGLPVIATNVGGISSLIKNKEDGILVNDNINDIYYATIELLENAELRHNISENSKKIARKRHNPYEIASKTIDIYKDIINNSNIDNSNL